MLDEPTAALGVAQTAEVLNLIERVRERGLGVIIISHNMEDVRAVADRIVVLRLGRNNGVFTPDSSNQELVAAITGATENAVSRRIERKTGAAHDFVRQMLADASGKPVIATKAEEPVLLGAAILGAVAGGLFSDMRAAMTKLSAVEKTYEPAQGAIADRHAKRYEGFRQFQTLTRELRKF